MEHVEFTTVSVGFVVLSFESMEGFEDGINDVVGLWR